MRSTPPASGLLPIVSGEKDNTVPRAALHAACKRQEHNAGVTEFAELRGRGHSPTTDSGWAEVAQTSGWEAALIGGTR